jgi:hypothetical protein
MTNGGAGGNGGSGFIQFQIPVGRTVTFSAGVSAGLVQTLGGLLYYQIYEAGPTSTVTIN